MRKLSSLKTYSSQKCSIVKFTWFSIIKTTCARNVRSAAPWGKLSCMMWVFSIKLSVRWFTRFFSFYAASPGRNRTNHHGRCRGSGPFDTAHERTFFRKTKTNCGNVGWKNQIQVNWYWLPPTARFLTTDKSFCLMQDRRDGGWSKGALGEMAKVSGKRGYQEGNGRGKSTVGWDRNVEKWKSRNRFELKNVTMTCTKWVKKYLARQHEW